MYEELVKHLRYCGNAVSCLHCPYWEGCGGSKEDLAEAADAIESMNRVYKLMSEAYEAEVTKQKWTPVTEQLPKEENRSYWICTDTGYQCECRWTNKYFGIGEFGEWGWCIVDVPQYQKVTAWMDLPEPYMPSNDDEDIP